MESIDFKGLDELDNRFDAVLKERPELRREMHNKVAKEIKYLVMDSIDQTGVRQGRGMGRSAKDQRPQGGLRDWQRDYVGTGGGYAAVRPIGKDDGGGTGPNSAGAITNYVNSGHRTRPPSDRTAAKKRKRVRRDYVNGRYFYQAADRQTQRIALDAANRYAERIAERLGD